MREVVRSRANQLVASLVALAMVGTTACTGQSTEQQVVSTSSTPTTSTSSNSAGFDVNEPIDEEGPAGTIPAVSDARGTVPILPYAEANKQLLGDLPVFGDNE